MATLINEKELKIPLILQGDATVAYRDPAAVYHDGKYHIFFTHVDNSEGGPWLQLAKITTSDFIEYSDIKILTEKDKSKNYSSPGNIVWHGDKWVMCMQTYCRENGEKYGNENSRIFTMESSDLETFSTPKLLRVKGDIPEDKMGRMIDPFLIKKDDYWWCFYKQNGVSYSKSKDMENWTPVGNVNGGENTCVIKYKDLYFLYHSPANGIGIKYSKDLINWEESGKNITLGQNEWSWARGRITAGFVIDVSEQAGKELYILLYHASGPEDEKTMFDSHASIGFAYSYNLDNGWTYKL